MSWKLERLMIEYRNYGSYKGQHVGTIRFSNGKVGEFQLNLSPEKTKWFLDLVSAEVKLSADDLAKRIKESI